MYVEQHPNFEYPLILALDVLEHVPDPLAFIKAIRQLLSPGGFFIIDTPNGESNSIKSEGGLWKGFNPFHIHVFSVASIQILLEKNGLNLHSFYEYSYDPFASGRSGVELKIRSMIKSFLTKAGLFSKIYQQYKRIEMRKELIKEPLLRVVNRIESDASSSPVFPKEFLREHGDNLLLICKKA